MQLQQEITVKKKKRSSSIHEPFQIRFITRSTYELVKQKLKETTKGVKERRVN